MTNRPYPALLAGAIALLFLSGCQSDNIEAAPPQPRRADIDRSIQLNVPRAMTGTVGAEAIVLGFDSVVVRGYGLVVGLNGTGCRSMPPQLRSHMLAEMSMRGVGQAASGWGEIKPEALLDSLETAVVIVEAVLPPGSVGRQSRRGHRIDGTRVDVRVLADPATDTTSLEGGRLYTAALRPVRPGEVRPPTGSRQAAVLAEARGPIFINPFADEGSGSVDATSGRIMHGGEVVKDLPLKLRLASPSHTRAEIIQSAINGRFPREPGQADVTARGMSDEAIRLTVPGSFRDRPDDFIQVLQHTTLRQTGAASIAQSLRQIVLDDPGSAGSVSWRWQALGSRVLPVIQPLYSSADVAPRLAAMRAGARLGDPMVVPALIEMTKSTGAQERREAASLMADMPLDPRIDRALRELLADDDVDVRLAAYDAQVARVDPYLTRRRVSNRFVLDIVDSPHPMIYITQVGEPRIAVFGTDLELARPLLVDAWDGRLLMKPGPDGDDVEVYYRREETGERVIELAKRNAAEFITFLGSGGPSSRPGSGLGLSYADTVGALYQMWKQDAIPADFRAERDRVLAAIRRQQQGRSIEARPEFGDPDFDILNPDVAAPDDADAPTGFVEPPPLIGS